MEATFPVQGEFGSLSLINSSSTPKIPLIEGENLIERLKKEFE
jgi:hypothetical protein